MGTLIKGIQVSLTQRTISGRNALNEPIYAESKVSVDNVLVQPLTAEEISRDYELYGRHSAYYLHIPKGDTHTWKDAVVDLGTAYGGTFRQYGDIKVYQDNLTPLDWDKVVMVERYE